MPIEVRLQDERGGNGIPDTPPPRTARICFDHCPLGFRRGQPFIGEFHRHGHGRLKFGNELSDGCRLLAFPSIHPKRQADNDPLHLMGCEQLADAAQYLAEATMRDDLKRLRDRSTRVGERDADALVAVI